MSRSFVKDSIIKSGDSVGINHKVPISFTGTKLKGSTAISISLGQIEQHSSSKSSDHFWFGDKLKCKSFSVTPEGLESGGRNDGKHDPREWLDWAGSCPA